MRLTGWDDKRFDVPERFAALARPAELTPLSTPWPAPLAPYRGLRATCRRLDARLPADRALWKPVWASRVLGRRERELFDALTLPENRAARVAGGAHGREGGRRRAAARRLRPRAAAGGDRDPARRARRAASCVAPGLEGLARLPIVSLTHAHGHAAALAALAPPGAGSGVGIDVEPLVAATAGLRAGGADRQPSGACSSRCRPDATEEWLLRLWCAREAAGKALGIGARRRLRRAARVARSTLTTRRCWWTWRPSDSSLDAARGRACIVATALYPGPTGHDELSEATAMTTLDPQVLQGILELLSEAQGDWEYDGRDRPGDALRRRPRPRVARDRRALDDGPAALRAAAVPPVLRRDRAAPGRRARPDRRGSRDVRVRAPSTDPPGGVTMGPTLLIGLDGATFTVLDPYMESGVMPFLGELLRARHARGAALDHAAADAAGVDLAGHRQAPRPARHLRLLPEGRAGQRVLLLRQLAGGPQPRRSGRSPANSSGA